MALRPVHAGCRAHVERLCIGVGVGVRVGCSCAGTVARKEVCASLLADPQVHALAHDGLRVARDDECDVVGVAGVDRRHGLQGCMGGVWCCRERCESRGV